MPSPSTPALYVRLLCTTSNFPAAAPLNTWGACNGLPSVLCQRSGTVYAMTKAAINQLAKNLACEWAADGIRVNSVAPWYTATPLTKPVREERTWRCMKWPKAPSDRHHLQILQDDPCATPVAVCTHVPPPPIYFPRILQDSRTFCSEVLGCSRTLPPPMDLPVLLPADPAGQDFPFRGARTR